jgi:hypothetical protein
MAMAEILMAFSRGIAASGFALIVLLLAAESGAAVDIEPGATASDVAAEGGNIVEECDDTADATCTVVINDAANEVGALVEVTANGSGIASGEIFSDFNVTGEGDGALVGSFLSGVVNVSGVLSSLGPNALASVKVSLEVKDTSSDVLIGAETVVDDAITDGTVPISAANAVAMQLPLTRGHGYRISLIIRAQAVGSPGDAAGASSDFASTASWSDLSVTAGADPFERIAELEQEVDQLREDFEGHSHTYLTGRGAGHNNTEAETGAPLFSGGEPDVDDGDGVEGDADLCPGSSAGADVDASGCELPAFCALQERTSDCSRADWRDDEAGNPRDCRWRSGTCEAL